MIKKGFIAFGERFFQHNYSISCWPFPSKNKDSCWVVPSGIYLYINLLGFAISEEVWPYSWKYDRLAKFGRTAKIWP